MKFNIVNIKRLTSYKKLIFLMSNQTNIYSMSCIFFKSLTIIHSNLCKYLLNHLISLMHDTLHGCSDPSIVFYSWFFSSITILLLQEKSIFVYFIIFLLSRKKKIFLLNNFKMFRLFRRDNVVNRDSIDA